ncbi:hypothetical protein NHG26_06060 [Aerococcaceae bacterium NML201296]|nr:hypothetical protein [Aerococcaceae bacterium NML201296]MCW6677476.1 hypothetical protein [Aerococcaceae bacterium NML180378]
MVDLRKQVAKLYQHHAEMPYISPERDLAAWLTEVELSSNKLVPKRNMIRLAEGILPGDIILLWRIQFGTYTNETVISKYFEYTYGIDARASLLHLIAQGYVVELSAHDSLDHVTAPFLRKILKEKGIVNLNKLKKPELAALIHAQVSEEALGVHFPTRQYALTAAGEQLLANHPEVIAKHPKKKF